MSRYITLCFHRVRILRARAERNDYSVSSARFRVIFQHLGNCFFSLVLNSRTTTFQGKSEVKGDRCVRVGCYITVRKKTLERY